MWFKVFTSSISVYNYTHISAERSDLNPIGLTIVRPHVSLNTTFWSNPTDFTLKNAMGVY